MVSKGASKSILLTMTAVFQMACSDALLTRPQPLATTVESAGSFCLQAPDLNNRITKFMFVIDKSGSNASSPGTDPNNAKRADNIEKFFNGIPAGATLARKDNPSVKWGYIKFQDSAATAYINDGSDSNPIYVGVGDVPDDKVAMANALSRQRSEPDDNATPYKEALAMTRKSIVDDMKLHKDEQSDYVIFFMSDGMPTDYSGGENPAGAEAFKDIDNLLATNPGHVTFSAAYYGENNPAAAEGLRQMAEVHGQGKFIDLNKSADFKIDDLLVGAKTAEPYALKQILVYNVNSAVCFDGTMGVDSDGDGLCDADEIALTKAGKGNFDPQNRFSFGDGYGDYFHYLAQLTKTNLNCTDRSDDDDDLLTACEEKYMFNQNPLGVQPNWHSKNTDPKNPDTDGDGFLDGIEFFMTHDKSSGMNNLNLTRHPTAEAPDMADLIIQHRNPLKWDPNLGAKDIYDTNVEPLATNDHGQPCFKFTQKHLKTYHTLAVNQSNALKPEYAHAEWENMVLVYYIQTLERDPSSPGIYMHSLQNITGIQTVSSTLGTEAGLKVNDSVFKTYKVPSP